MNKNNWELICRFREEFKSYVESTKGLFGDLKLLQEQIREKEKLPFYEIENPIVYNKAIDEISTDDEIKLIVIGDNPGKDEQLDMNQRYLVGQAGKLGNGFFRNNPELSIDFRKNVLIMNKTPLHTAKTVQLKYFKNSEISDINNLLVESQLKMAQLISDLHKGLVRGTEIGDRKPELWLVGYSELKEKGLFQDFKRKLVENYLDGDSLMGTEWDYVKVYQHFSMNRFSIDLKQFCTHSLDKNLAQNLSDLGQLHRKEIFGF